MGPGVDETSLKHDHTCVDKTHGMACGALHGVIPESVDRSPSECIPIRKCQDEIKTVAEFKSGFGAINSCSKIIWALWIKGDG